MAYSIPDYMTAKYVGCTETAIKETSLGPLSPELLIPILGGKQ